MFVSYRSVEMSCTPRPSSLLFDESVEESRAADTWTRSVVANSSEAILLSSGGPKRSASSNCHPASGSPCSHLIPQSQRDEVSAALIAVRENAGSLLANLPGVPGDVLPSMG
jgi:hypothetical protein